MTRTARAPVIMTNVPGIPSSKSAVSSPPRSLPVLLALLAISVFINYIDRGNLSIAAPMLKGELGLTASRLGVLLSAFFWTYGLAQIVSGLLVERFNVSWVMGIGFFLWSAATSVTGLLHGFIALLVVRLVLGIGESVAYPAYSLIIARYFHESKRASANSVIASGLAAGPAFGMLLGGILMSRFGWRPFFIVLGAVSLLWLIPWFRWRPRGPGLAPKEFAVAAPKILEMLRQRPFWGSLLGLFCNGYGVYFLITWLPFYLIRERHFSMDSMAKIGGAVFITQALFSIACGKIGDRWIAAGASRTRVHMTLMSAGAVGAAGFLMASVTASPPLAVPALLLVGASIGLCMANTWPITQTLAGPQASGQWTGLQCAFGNSSGVAVSLVTGFLLDRTGHFFWAFAVTAAISILGMFVWIFLVSPVEPVVWGQKPPVNLDKARVKLASA